MRVFLGYPISDEIGKILGNIADELVKYGKIKSVSPENMHITLRFFVEIDARDIEGLIETLSDIHFTPFDVSVKGLGAFPNPGNVRILWAGIDEGAGVIRLGKKMIDSALIPSYGSDEQNFHPHITIARVKGQYDRLTLKKLLDDSGKNEFGRCQFGGPVLYSSELTPTGPIYDILKRF